MKFVFPLAVLLCAAPALFATPACVPGTAADYVALGSTGCQVGSVVFTDFVYFADAIGVPLPSADRLTITPSTTTLVLAGTPFEGEGFDLGFNLRMVSGPVPLSLNTGLTYVVNAATGVVTGGALFAELGQEGTVLPSVGSLMATDCALRVLFATGGMNCGLQDPAPAVITNVGANLSAMASSRFGVAEVATASLRYTVDTGIPEPSTWLLMGCALLALRKISGA